MARQHERGDLGIAEPLEQAPDVSIDRLLPDAPAPIEVAAHERAVDAGIDGGRIEGHQAALRIADDADLRGFHLRAPRSGGQVAAPRAKAVHRREHLLDFVANDVPPHVERLPIQPFAPGLLAPLELFVGGLNQFASDQYGDDQFAVALSESPGELLFTRQSG